MNRGEQQDPQEFSKLFFGRIESMRVSGRDRSRPSLQSLLQGSLGYRTRCSTCRQDSGLRRTPFLELDVSLEGHEDLQKALNGLFHEELLQGDNQYYCTRCATKRDAVRSISLQVAPAVLNLQLLRYVFHKQSGEKRKLKQPLSFPPQLQLSVSPQEQEGEGEGEEQQEVLTYDLVSVLYHKGGTAHGGHYVAEVLDWRFGDWWHCDDGHVAAVTCPATLVVGEGRRTGKKEKVSESERESVVDLVDAAQEVVDVNAVRSEGARLLERNKDAYMLSYVRTAAMEEFRSSQRRGIAPPDALRQQVLSAAQSHLEAVHLHREAQHLLAARIEERRRLYADLVEAETLSAARGGDEGSFCLIPADFLSRWVRGDPSTLGVALDLDLDLSQLKSCGVRLDLLPFLCDHKTGIAPSAIESFKVVSEAAYRSITRSRVVDWDFTHLNFRCEECYNGTMAAWRRLREERVAAAELLALIDAPCDNSEKEKERETSFRLSKQWIKRFRKTANRLQRAQFNADAGVHAWMDLEEPVNADLFCADHLDQAAADADCASRAVSAAAWLRLKSLFSKAMSLSSAAPPCPHCTARDEDAARSMEEERRLRDLIVQDSALLRLSRAKKILPEPWTAHRQTPLFLVDGRWLARWRTYLTDPTMPHPGPLTNESLRCSHDLLVVNNVWWLLKNHSDLTSLPEDQLQVLSLKKQLQLLDDERDRAHFPRAELVSENQWRMLLNLFAAESIGGDGRGTKAEVFQVAVTVDAGPLFQPMVCEECCGEWEAVREEKRTRYEGAELVVRVLRDEDELAAMVAQSLPSTGAAALPSRGTARTRAARMNRGVVKVRADSADSVSMLKLRLYEAATSRELPPGRQRLFDRSGRELVDSASLVQEEVRVGDELWLLLRDGEDNAADFDDFLFDASIRSGRREEVREVGFGGTFLSDAPGDEEGPCPEPGPRYIPNEEIVDIDIVESGADSPLPVIDVDCTHYDGRGFIIIN